MSSKHATARAGAPARHLIHDRASIELGYGWLHSANKNELSALAAKSSVNIDKTQPPWGIQMSDIGFPAGRAG